MLINKLITMYKHFFFFLLCCIFMLGCNNDIKDSVKTEGSDPSKPVVFDDFTPKEGTVRTRLYITGNNFGTDVDKIHVIVGGKSAKVIGSNGNKIYCMVPKRAYDGLIQVDIEGASGDTLVNYTFDDMFTYHAHQTVGTLIRRVDEKGNSLGDIVGPLSEASISSVDFMHFLSKPGEYKDVYISGWGSGIHKIDLLKGTYEVLIPHLHNEMRSFTFTAEGDTLLMPDDNGQAYDRDRPTIYYALRSEGFKNVRPYYYGTCSFTVCSHPIDHTVFYQSWANGGVYKMNGQYNASTQQYEPKKIFELSSFLTASGGLKMNFIVHPSGKYMYIVGIDMHAILKSNYNFQTHEFEYPIIVAGSVTGTGYAEGVGSVARFSSHISQGVFVKNQEYVKEGKEDVYDFYVADSYNDCIRKITPEGATSLMAGRANINVDGKSNGYVDGDPLKEARFHQCQGIAYDPDTETFYVGEWNNHAVRYITTE